jgi:anti-sigma factor RsiW
MSPMMREDLELLVQRFLDGELSRPERRTLLQRLGHDSDLRQRLLSDEAMLDAAASLPPMPLPAGFVADTLARLPDAVDAPADTATPSRRSTRWMAAAAVAASMLLAVGFWLGRTSAPEPSRGVVTSDVATEILVRLVLVQPDAQSVALVGDFNGWDASSTPLERLDGGVWSTTLALPPGRYHYMFLVDGKQWVADPLAAETSLDGFGAQNSVLNVEI